MKVLNKTVNMQWQPIHSFIFIQRAGKVLLLLSCIIDVVAVNFRISIC